MVLCLLAAACGSGDGGTVVLFPNTLVTVTPLEGTSAGGTEVTLTGTGFQNPAFAILRILFGEEVATDWEVLSDTTIVVTAPPGPLGSTIITLWGADIDKPLLTGGYRYIALTLYVAGGAQALTTSLFRIDLDSAFVGLVGPIGFPVTSLATRADGTLFGVEDDPQRRLIRISPDTGQGTPVALLRDVATGAPVDILDLTFLGSRLLGRTALGEVVEIDITLGGVTFLPPLVGPAPGPGICIYENGLSYLTGSIGDAIYTWGPNSGALLPGPTLTSAVFTTIDALEYLDGTVFGVSHDVGTNASTLVTVNPFIGPVDLFVALPDGITAVTRDL